MKTYIFTTLLSLVAFLSFPGQGQAQFFSGMSQQNVHMHHHGHNHHGHDHSHAHGGEAKQGIFFVENQHQWHEKVRFRTRFGNGTVFFEDQAFTYLFAKADELEMIHEVAYGSDSLRAAFHLNLHAYQVQFRGANTPQFNTEETLPFYHNYFIGNDPSKWSTKVPIHQKIIYEELYDGIKLAAYSKDHQFKYDFIVAPGSSPSQIQLDYRGMDALEIDNGNLIIHTSVETVVEHEPYAYQIIDGQEIKVPCDYELDYNTVCFSFPQGYDPNYELIIDPTVVAATLTGTVGSSYNFGHTATYDNEGNIYAGGIAFGTGYPTTVGSFQSQFEGGQTDIAISKYNPTGTTLIYATYIGGVGADYSHSLVADFDQQLYIYGSTSSFDFPVTGNAVQTDFGGVVDIVVTKLNSDGSILVGSTYMGGNEIDGQNYSMLNTNYGDRYRGEIIIDNQGNAYVASCSRSNDFPVTQNAHNTTFNPVGDGSFAPAQDGVVFKLNSDMSTLFWSTYLGEDDLDIALGLRLDDFNNVYVTGVAGHSNFPTTGGTVQPTWGGDEEDAFVALLSNNGNDLIASTFWGTNGNDHAYFMDVDEDGNVHIYGQTTGNMPITPNTYSFNAGSLQFLASFSGNLEDVIYSTVVGTGPNAFDDYDFVPVAFMVDKCNNIYFSGYYANGGLPTTSDAIATTPNTFYLGVLEPNASALSFGTYYGNADHVDGGTSRFDKSGTVYQAVCSCTSSGIMNTLPNAHATGQTTFCDIGVFKIDFDINTVTAAMTAFPATSGCAPFEVDFRYTGQDATSFFWDFDDDGATSLMENPIHTFEEAGIYNVMLIANAPNTCNIADTSFMQISVLDGSSTISDTAICNQDELLFLDATTSNATYQWQDGSTGATYTANGPGIYWVDVTIIGCTRRDSFVIDLANTLSLELGPDVTVCDQNAYVIDATTPGAASYVWQNGSNTPTFTAINNGIYSVDVYDSNGCIISDEISLQFGNTPTVNLGPDQLLLCDGQPATFDVSMPGVDFLWQDGSTEASFTTYEEGLIWVTVDDNGCAASDTALVTYLEDFFFDYVTVDVECFEECTGEIEVDASGGNGTLFYQWSTGSTNTVLTGLCAGEYTLTVTDDFCTYVNTITIFEPGPLSYEVLVEDVECYGDQDGSVQIVNAAGGTEPYAFSFDGGPFSEQTTFNGLNGGNFEFEFVDANGCSISDNIFVYEPPEFTVDAGPDITIELGGSAQLDPIVFPFTNQTIIWSPSDSLSCMNCIDPLVDPSNSTLYTIAVIDSVTGCTLLDEVWVRVEKPRNVFIPNAFSPNGDGTNDLFRIFSGQGVRSILDFKVFDRWGELVYEAQNLPPKFPTGWDGSFKGKDMNTAVFTYLAQVEFLDDVIILFKGDVTLLR